MGKNILLFDFGKPIYEPGFIKFGDLNSFYYIIHHHSFLNPSYTTELSDRVTTWLLNDQIQCNSILLVYALPTFLKNPYKPCMVLVKMNSLHLAVWDQNQIKILFLCQDNRKERSKALSLRPFVDMPNLLLMTDTKFQGPKPQCNEIFDEGVEETFFIESKQSWIWPLMKTQLPKIM